MKKDTSHYKKLSLLALLLFLILVVVQVCWLYKAVHLDKQEQKLKLEGMIADLALDINSLGHNYFHGKAPKLDSLDMTKVDQIVNEHLKVSGLTGETYYAIYQDSIEGLYKSNSKEFMDSLLNSEVKSCMSCIISFSIAKSVDKKIDETEEAFEKRLNQVSTFQYYSPVSHLTDTNGKTIWLALYQPPDFFRSFASLWYLFVSSVLLSLGLLYLFYYLLQSLSNYRRLTEMKDVFFNNMTHEFKTPLSSIRLASTVLKQNKHPDKNQSYYNLIEKETKILETQIDKLLELSLIDNKELALQKEPLQLFELIQQVSQRMKPQLEEKNASLILDLDNSGSKILGDKHHLLNSFCNLVENSLKYAEHGVEIKIKTKEEGSKKIVIIQDNGPGIAEEYQSQIFERFYRGQKGNQYKTKGFGIGLSYVKSIIEEHGGEIILDTNLKKGARFIIKL